MWIISPYDGGDKVLKYFSVVKVYRGRGAQKEIESGVNSLARIYTNTLDALTIEPVDVVCTYIGANESQEDQLKYDVDTAQWS